MPEKKQPADTHSAGSPAAHPKGARAKAAAPSKTARTKAADAPAARAKTAPGKAARTSETRTKAAPSKTTDAPAAPSKTTDAPAAPSKTTDAPAAPGKTTDALAPRKRADARRNEQTLLDAAAEAFVATGIDATVREIAARAGVGIATIYRHFPTRADLVVAVFKHQLDALATTAGTDGETPFDALRSWVSRFADFLITKHGLAEALHSDQAGLENLHTEFVERLLPVLDALLKDCAEAGQARTDIRAYDLMLAIGNLCIGAGTFPGYRSRRMIELLLTGLTVVSPRS